MSKHNLKHERIHQTKNTNYVLITLNKNVLINDPERPLLITNYDIRIKDKTQRVTIKKTQSIKRKLDEMRRNSGAHSFRVRTRKKCHKQRKALTFYLNYTETIAI